MKKLAIKKQAKLTRYFAPVWKTNSTISRTLNNFAKYLERQMKENSEIQVGGEIRSASMLSSYNMDFDTFPYITFSVCTDREEWGEMYKDIPWHRRVYEVDYSKMPYIVSLGYENLPGFSKEEIKVYSIREAVDCFAPKLEVMADTAREMLLDYLESSDREVPDIPDKEKLSLAILVESYL